MLASACIAVAAGVPARSGAEPTAVFSAVASDSEPSAFRAWAGLPGDVQISLAPTRGSLGGKTPRQADGDPRFLETRGPLPLALIERAPAPLAVADRDRLAEHYGLVRERLWNPYEQNTLKGDRPIFGRSWYLDVGLQSDSVVESGRSAADGRSGETSFVRQQVTPSLGLVKGKTVFQPPAWQLRGAASFVYTGADSLGMQASDARLAGDRRTRVGLEALFVERFLRSKSDRYDFEALRIGVQPFITDFRGFLLDDDQPAIRWFGNAADNRFQHNVAWIRRFRKDRSTGLNTTDLRDEDLIVANLYVQDSPWLGFQWAAVGAYHRDRERAPVLLSAPQAQAREPSGGHEVAYLGLHGDGHIGRLNLTFGSYLARGRDEAESGQSNRSIRASFGAIEASIDFDWYRVKAFGLRASGDSDPLDDESGGFDFVRDRPTFGGLEDGFFQRESLPLFGAATDVRDGLLLVSRDGLLPSLRSNRDRDAASFVHPGLRLFGVGADLDVLPELRLRLSASHLSFDATSSLELLRGARVARHIGEDYALALIYRPLLVNNIAVRVSAGTFRTGRGLAEVLGLERRERLYSTRIQLTLAY